MKNVELLPKEYLVMMEEDNETQERVVCDYVAGMTDRFAVGMFSKLILPRSWSIY